MLVFPRERGRKTVRKVKNYGGSKKQRIRIFLVQTGSLGKSADFLSKHGPEINSLARKPDSPYQENGCPGSCSGARQEFPFETWKLSIVKLARNSGIGGGGGPGILMSLRTGKATTLEQQETQVEPDHRRAWQ